MKTNQKLRAAVWYYYRRALPALLICTGISLLFGLVTAPGNGLSRLTMFGVNGRFFWMLFMLFSAKSFENVFLQTSISRKTQYKAFLRFLPFGVLVATLNMLLVCGSILLHNALLDEQLKRFSYVPIEDLPFSVFHYTNGFSEDTAGGTLLLLALVLSTLKILRGMVFGVLLAKLLQKFSQQKLSKPIKILIVGSVLVLLFMLSMLGEGGLTSVLGSGIFYFICTVFFGNGGASATLSVLFADILMLCIYLLLLRLLDGAGHLQKKRVVRSGVSIAVLLVLCVLNTCFCTPAAVNLLECHPEKYYDSETGKDKTAYNLQPNETAFRLLQMQRKFATPTYKQNLDWHLFRFYYMPATIDCYMSQKVPNYKSTAVDYVYYADGAALLDGLLAYQIKTEYYYNLPLISPANNTFNQDWMRYETNKNILEATMAYHCSNQNPERSMQLFEDAMANDDLTDFNTVKKYGGLLSVFFTDEADVAAWVTEQYDFLADICIQKAEEVEASAEPGLYAFAPWRDIGEKYRKNADALRAGETLEIYSFDLNA